MAFWVRLRHPELEQHVAKFDWGGARVADDASTSTKWECGHRDKILWRRSRSVHLNSSSLLRLKSHKIDQKLYLHFKDFCLLVHKFHSSLNYRCFNPIQNLMRKKIKSDFCFLMCHTFSICFSRKPIGIVSKIFKSE